MDELSPEMEETFDDHEFVFGKETSLYYHKQSTKLAPPNINAISCPTLKLCQWLHTGHGLDNGLVVVNRRKTVGEVNRFLWCI